MKLMRGREKAGLVKRLRVQSVRTKTKKLTLFPVVAKMLCDFLHEGPRNDFLITSSVQV